MEEARQYSVVRDAPPPLDLKRRIEIAARLTERARTYFDIFEFLEDVETRSVIIGVMNDYPWFFRLLHHVHRFAFIVEVAGLFKRKKGTVNFPDLLDESRSKTAEAERTTLLAILEAATPIADKAEGIRSAALAHRSATVDVDDAFVKADVTRNELRALTEHARELARALCRIHDVQEVPFVTDETRRDTRRLFAALGAKFEAADPKTALDELYGE